MSKKATNVHDSTEERDNGVPWHIAYIAKLGKNELGYMGRDFANELARRERTIPDAVPSAYYYWDEDYGWI